MSIQSIERAINILNLFRDNKNLLSLGEIAESMGLAKTTVHTIVKTLARKGFLFQDEHSKKYSLGFSLFELGMKQAGNLEINRNATVAMHQLANDTGSYCRLAVWDLNTVFITMTVHPQGIDSHSRQLGPRLPGYCTSLGKSMLAQMTDDRLEIYLETVELKPYTEYTITDGEQLLDELNRVRKKGYAISNREILLHQVGIGAPIFGENGKLAGAASIQLNPEEVDSQKVEMTASRLLRTTYEISSNLGYRPISIQPQ